MSATKESTVLVSLFHTHEHAAQATQDLREAGIPVSDIQTLGSETSQTAAPEHSLTALRSLNLPGGDLEILAEGLKAGGIVIIVRTEHALSEKAEDIFERYQAHKIDERSNGVALPYTSPAALADEVVIPVVEESLVVGKRKVERGGVRVFSRIVETPVEEQVVLREEHATIQRTPLNHPLSTSEMDALKDQTIEVHQLAEEAVVGKTARVVEEVKIGTEALERTQQIRDTVRKTEVEVDELSHKANG